ncbi:MAG TPA: FtsX-like permease family protein, partial [Acetobacteraceae bacterium]|nr:FtsX-like permease family protein [Acetobacteraceae bacterium]
PAYPLVGTAGLHPPGGLDAALARQGIVAEQLVADRLGIRPGATLRLGDATVRFAAILTDEPDRAASAELLGPTVLIATASLPATGLVQPGSLLSHALRATLPPGTDIGATIRALRAAFPDTGWRIRDAAQAAPGIQRFIDQAGLFMTLVGLATLLVGGIGVATGVRGWMEARARSIATLRCLGASGRLILAVYLIQTMALAAVGVAIGLVLAALVPAAAGWALAGALPVPPRAGLYPDPLLLAAAYGFLTAACFALWPLGRAARIPGAALFRDPELPQRVVAPARLLAANTGLAAALVALTVGAAADRGFALWFCAVAAATLLLFRLGGAALMRAAALAPRRLRLGPATRLGVANLHRPGSAARLTLAALGLGLSTLAAVALIEGNMRRQISAQIPHDAPSFFFIDIQPADFPRFLSLVHATPGAGAVESAPSLRARIVAVNGVPAEQVQATPGTRWALRGDRGLTYAATLPAGTHLAAGHWWRADYAGPPLVSFDAGLARGWGVRVGDTIRVNVLGRDIDLRVASLRDIDWRSFGLNFTLVASPGLLAQAPHMEIATVRVPAAAQGALLRRVTDALPGVTGIAVADVLAAIATVLGQIGTALAATGAVTLAAGALVLAGAVAAGQRRRIREAVILRSVGATRAQIRAAWMAEFGIIGAAAGLIAAAVGTAASWGVMRFVLHADWAFLPGPLAASVLGSMVLVLLLGWIGTAAALRAPAAATLRQEG